MNIAMIGGGYVGLVSAACLAGFGWQVACVERDERRVAMLRDGVAPFYEPGLEALLRDGLAAGRLRFGSDAAAAVAASEVVFVAVGTPMRRGDARADMADVAAAVEAAAAALPAGCVVAMKSTVPVGTADEMEARIAQLRPGLDFDLVSNPEFLRQGAAVDDFVNPARVVVGAAGARGREAMAAVYAPLAQKGVPLLFVDRRSAEMGKYAANAFLAAKVALIGEVADVCEAAGADVEAVARIVGGDGRIGAGGLKAGAGFGGSCLPKDVAALVAAARGHGVRCRLGEAVIEANEARKRGMAARVIQAAGGDVHGRIVGVLGVAFKPDTDDMRAAPSLEILPALQSAGALVRAYDPQAMRQAAALLPGVEWRADARSALQGAHVGVILTEWAEFRRLDLAGLRAGMAGDVLVDLRNIYRRAEAQAAGFDYHCIGSRHPGAGKEAGET